MKKNRPLIEQLERPGGQTVLLRYEERFFRLFWEGETRYFVTGIEAVEQESIEQKLTGAVL
jgi:hypothetical protein